MMRTITEKVEKSLLRKFHTLCGKLGMSDEEKKAVVRSCGCESSRDLTARDLMDICDRLDRELHPAQLDMDKWRKRLIAAIGGWLRAMGRKNEIGLIKAVACRASRKERFNEIPLEQLRSLYNAFLKKGKDIEMVDEITADELDILIISN